MERVIAPSILAADFGYLQRDVEMINRSEAAWIHVDVMDGVFVPNLSFGFPVLRAVRKATEKVVDVHLMITEPERYVARFAHDGADWVTFHLEATEDPMHCAHLIRESGAKVGISIKPATPVEALREVLAEVDMVLVMTVEPGFGGQSFMPETMEKIKTLREEIKRRGLTVDIQVDGGINEKTVETAAAAGANVFVAGSAVFGADDASKAISDLRSLAEKVYAD